MIFWWQHLEFEIEGVGKSCTACLEAKQAPSRAHFTHGPGQVNHGRGFIIDYTGPFLGRIFLLVVDTHIPSGEK